MPEEIQIRYIPIEDARLFDRNIKRHDIGLICESIEKYGFRNPPLWDATLNDGSGGIVAGNGRVEALQKMRSAGFKLPRGIRSDESGSWCIPIVFGCDANSESDAARFALDDNLLCMAGGDFSAHDISKMFDSSFISQLQEMQDEGELPIAFDADYFDALRRYEELQQEEDEGDRPCNRSITCPECGHHFTPKRNRARQQD